MSTQGPNDVLTGLYEDENPAFDSLATDVPLLFNDSALLPSSLGFYEASFSPFPSEGLYEPDTMALLFTHTTFEESAPEKKPEYTTQSSSTTFNHATVNSKESSEYSENSEYSDSDSDSEAIDSSYDLVKIRQIKKKILSAKKAILEYQIEKNDANTIENPSGRRKEINRISAGISRQKKTIFSLKQELKIMQLIKENIELRERVAKLEQAISAPNETMISQSLLLPQYQASQSPKTSKNIPLVPSPAKKRPRYSGGH
ncbi:bZIP transcription factor [Candidatus Berkiella aquae]|uniref:Basic region leucine zipper n=1 Tax=Candidatus Berkiella aquae TaxID=295108 RepID=A0A0Q9YWS8_9GAMM|nr:bZIP transcription factor [Candidatus Berkiella aquae]MCS5711173.1 hypothetical protein [Candidatus Berkiella aquae]